jgi:hypothetical protein
VGLGSLGSSSCLPSGLASARIFKDNTISSLGILAASAPTLCQFLSPPSCWFDLMPLNFRATPRSFHSPGDVICFDTYAEQFAFWDNTVVRSINETISTDFRDPEELDEFYSRVSETDTKLEEFGRRCLASKTGPYLKYVGTTSTIRDLVSLADAIVGADQPINYYGYSYGTVIGAHFLNSQ